MVRHKIAIIGGGRLGSTLALALSRKHRVVISDPNPDALYELSKKSKNMDTTLVNSEAVDSSSVVLLAVKPAVTTETISSMKQSLHGKLMISCAAGTSISKIENAGADRVIRMMPNICAEVGEGVFAYCLGTKAKPEDETAFASIFSDIGRCIKIDEKHMNAITGASGSGPAFIAFFAKAIYESAVEAGLSEEVAKHAVAQTLVGTGKMLLQEGKTFEQLIATVASPGGTTEAGLKKLEADGVYKAIHIAVADAIKKAKELEGS